MSTYSVTVNDGTYDVRHFLSYHRRRIGFTVEKLRELGAAKIVEVGGHPWALTAQLIEESDFEVCATISAEEETQWPDDIALRVRPYKITTSTGKTAKLNNYTVNIERRMFDIQETPDTVLACEVIEHLIRSPHVMLLNANRWLSVGGKLLVTTPNGAQFANPFRRKTQTPSYRSNVYERHFYLYTLDNLVDLVTLCGFRIVEAAQVDLFSRRGLSRLYGWLARLPNRYCHEKFRKTLFITAEKVSDVRELSRCPKAYDSRGHWEHVALSNGNKL